MRRRSLMLFTFPAFAVVLALAGCASSSASGGAPSSVSGTQGASSSAAVTPRESPFGFRDATGVAIALIATIRSAHKYVTVTEKNDPNNLIGRSNGYRSAAVVYDIHAQCVGGLGVDCGATVEQWPTSADAKARSAYIISILKKSPALGSEYDTTEGPYVIRVSGKLKPSQAKQYRAALEEFGAASFGTPST